MPCYPFKTAEGVVGIICGKLGDRCGERGCRAVAGLLCDYPVRKGKTCDRKICDQHAHEIGPDLHYCEEHWRISGIDAAHRDGEAAAGT